MYFIMATAGVEKTDWGMTPFGKTHWDELVQARMPLAGLTGT